MSDMANWTLKQRVDGVWLIKDGEENIAVFDKAVDEETARGALRMIKQGAGVAE